MQLMHSQTIGLVRRQFTQGSPGGSTNDPTSNSCVVTVIEKTGNKHSAYNMRFWPQMWLSKFKKRNPRWMRGSLCGALLAALRGQDITCPRRSFMDQPPPHLFDEVERPSGMDYHPDGQENGHFHRNNHHRRDEVHDVKNLLHCCFLLEGL